MDSHFSPTHGLWCHRCARHSCPIHHTEKRLREDLALCEQWVKDIRAQMARDGIDADLPEPT